MVGEAPAAALAAQALGRSALPHYDPISAPDEFSFRGAELNGSFNSGEGGTHLGSLRDQALVSYDYDVDVSLFLVPGADFDSLWR